jgi:DivIVA domain-containing protein
MTQWQQGPLNADQLRQATFRRPVIGRRGYNEQDVENFLHRVADAFDGTAPPIEPDEVHNVVFGRPPFGHRGYHLAEVDGYLDRLEQQLRERAHH